MNKLRLIVLMIIYISKLVIAETAFDLSDVGISAESVALGGISSSCQTSQCLFSNPALLDESLSWSLDVFQFKTITDAYIQNISFAKSYKKYVVGVGYNGTRVDGIETTAFANNEGGYLDNKGEIKRLGIHSYEYGNYYLSGKVAVLNNIALGISLKYTHINLADKVGNGINSDIGIMWKNPNYQLNFGIHNILQFQKINYEDSSELDYVSETYPLKLLMSGTTSYTYKDLQLNFFSQLNYQRFNLNNSRYTPLLYSLGTKWSLLTVPYFELLLGYRRVPYLDQTRSRLAIGVNFNLNNLKLSYGFEKSQTPLFNNHHYISLSIFKDSSLRHQKENKNQSKKEVVTNKKEEILHIKGQDGKVYRKSMKEFEQEEEQRIKVKAKLEEKIKALTKKIKKAQKDAEKQVLLAQKETQLKSKKANLKIALAEKAVKELRQLQQKLSELQKEYKNIKNTKSSSQEEAKLSKIIDNLNLKIMKAKQVSKKQQEEAVLAEKEMLKAQAFEKKISKKLEKEVSELNRLLDNTKISALQQQSRYSYTLITGTFVRKSIAKVYLKKQQKQDLFPKIVKEKTIKEGKVIDVYRLKLKEYSNLKKAKELKEKLNQLQIRNYILVQRKDSVVEPLKNKLKKEAKINKSKEKNNQKKIIKKSKNKRFNQKAPVLIVNLSDSITISTTRDKMGVSGKAINIDSLSVNGQPIIVRPDNKFYSVVALPNESEFELRYEAIGINGTKNEKVIVVKRQGL